MTRRILLALVGALAGLAALPLGASAGDQAPAQQILGNVVWCVGDPPVLVVTPGGTELMFNTSLFAFDRSDSAALRQSAVTALTQDDGSGGTLVAVTVTVPDGVGD